MQARWKTDWLNLAERAIQAEKPACTQPNQRFHPAHGRQLCDQQADERLDLLDIFLENNEELYDSSPKEFFNQLQTQVHLKLNLDSGITQAIKEDPDEMPVILRTLVEETLLKIVLSRMIMTIERRINSRLIVDLDQLAALDWVSIENRLVGGD